MDRFTISGNGPNDYRELGRQDYDDTLALNAEMVPPVPRGVNWLFVIACVFIPGGVFVLGLNMLYHHLKEKQCR